MKECVSGIVSTASNTATYQADPQVGVGAADAAFVQSRLFARHGVPLAETVLRIATHWATAASPLLQAGAMKDVLAEYRKKAS